MENDKFKPQKQCAIPIVICSCSEIIEKKKGRIYVDEECGNKASYTIQYELNGKITVKTLCKRHYKSVTAWLDRINVVYNCL